MTDDIEHVRIEDERTIVRVGTPSALPHWMLGLPMQQQSVLILALRGPDGVRKHHPMKNVQRHYRGSILRAAKYGRSLRVGESADSFMSLELVADATLWDAAVRMYFDHLDELPHHFHMHLAHGAQILGYRHPDDRIRRAWSWFYLRSCEDAHMTPESEEEMNNRLGDWGREHWSD